MNIITRLSLFSALFITFVLLSNCTTEAVSGPNYELIGFNAQPSAIEFIESSQDLSEFENIIKGTGWDEKIMTTDSFTLFAPTNDAFKQLITDNEAWNSINDIPIDMVIDMLDYHLVKDKGYILRDTITEFIPTQSVSSFDGQNTLFIKTEGSIRINGERAVALQDVRVQNAVIHMMDAVVAPINLLAIVEAHPELSTFAQIFERVSIAADINELLGGDGPFTIFAPTDSAFLDLFKELEINSLGGIPADVLEQVLLNHIVPSNNLYTENLIPSNKISTLLPNQELTVGVSNNIKNVRSNTRTANLVITNGQGANGIIHLIDKVLVPTN